jgi:hypothetical protein
MPVVHDVVEIDADAEAVGGFHQLEQLRLGAVAGAHAAALVFGAEVEGVPQVIAHGKPAAALGRRRQPQRAVSGLGQFGHLAGDFRPACIEILEHRLATEQVGEQHKQQQDARGHGFGFWRIECPS